MRNVILAVAVTLDGYIEGPGGEFDWCFTDQDYGMNDFLKEVDAAKKQIKELNDQVAAKDRELEALLADKGEKDTELTTLNEQTTSRRNELAATASGLDAGLADHGRQRDGLTERLPVALRKRYDMLLERRNGLAVVEARDGACLGCHMHLPPQLFNRLYVAKEVQSCPHCNRLLYLSVEQG